MQLRKTQLVALALLMSTAIAVGPAQAVGVTAPQLGGPLDQAIIPQSVIDARIAEAKDGKHIKITQEEREGAAARARLLAGLAGVGVPGGKAISALPKPGPGGQPDYFSLDTPNWAWTPEIRKFVDTLPGLGPDGANNLGNFLPVAHPDTVTYPGSDYYEIEVREYDQKMHSDLPPTRLRGYVQVNKGTDAQGNNTIAPEAIHYLGPTIIAQKDRPVRIKFTNKLPTGQGGDLFIPVDETVMGAGVGPLGVEGGTYPQNRAVLHLHGGRTPWISDGTPHQWITPAGENTNYPKGVSVRNVPDMPDPGDGSQTYYFTNQQSARMMWMHDHSWGITRLNVYVGEAQAYILRDDVENQLIADGIIPADEIPLVFQDKTFVNADTISDTDPTWNWGTSAPIPNTGDLWLPHVYMPAQNPYDLTGVAPMGRWMYGPWFWPPTTNIAVGPQPNPYYDEVNAPWQPPEIPGVPNVSMGMEAFHDTPIVNGTPYPSLTLDPKAYRFRMLNAANDRFFNLQTYLADPDVVTRDERTDTEVRMVEAERSTPGIAGTDWPTDGRDGGVPDPLTQGPDWIMIGSEGGFLPEPAVIPNQPITWNMNPTTFNFGNVDLHSLLLGPAERADVIVDFSAYAGKTLIMYNDAPTAFPALDPRYDYYTGSPDMTAEGGYWGTPAGFGPNTRTVMQIKIRDTQPAEAFNLGALEMAFWSSETTPGVFARGQDPIIVAQAAYDATYNKTFPTRWPYWGYSRIQDKSMRFQTLAGTTMTIDMQPKAIHDEMGAAYDREFGRMSGNLGLELPTTTAVNQTFILYGFIDPPTENLKDAMTPMSPVQGDGTQIWKITHNGVDTHPVHFHLFDVQLINRVGWDGIIRLPEKSELGWKDTVRISPLEDTIVALRPVSPKTPFGVPDSVRPLNPAIPLGSTAGFSGLDPLTGQATATPVTNEMTNFGWEYVWHCHILSHEEMDMMRPITFTVARSLAVAPGLSAERTAEGVSLIWADGTPPAAQATMGNPRNEVGYHVQRAVNGADGPGAYATIGEALANCTSYTDTNAEVAVSYSYRVVAYNAAGDSPSNVVVVKGAPPAAPSTLTAVLSGTDVQLQFTDNATWETGFEVERAVSGGAFTKLATVGASAGTGAVTYLDTTAVGGTTYQYRVRAVNVDVFSGYSNTATIIVPAPLTAPSNLRLQAQRAGGTTDDVTVRWNDNSTGESGFTIQRATDAAFTTGLTVINRPANTASYTDRGLPRNVRYYYRVRAYVTAPAQTSAWTASGNVLTP